MFGPKLLGPEERVMIGGMTCGEWEQSSMLVANGVRAGIGRNSTGLVEAEGCHFGVAPTAEQTLLVAGEEASPAVNMMAFYHCRVWKGTRGDLGKGGPLGDMMARVWRTSRMDGTVGTRVVLESSP